MLTRRAGLALAAGAAIVASRPPAANAAAASTVKTPVNFPIPAGACDCHVHVFPDPARFPFWSGRGYTPPVATANDLLALQRALHLDRVVIVTPSVYGTDNAATLARRTLSAYDGHAAGWGCLCRARGHAGAGGSEYLRRERDFIVGVGAPPLSGARA